MREPKYSDAPCFGKEFDAQSKVCGICLGNKSCRQKYFQTFAGTQPAPVKFIKRSERILLKAPSAAARRYLKKTIPA
jgi:hypothetical protein